MGEYVYKVTSKRVALTDGTFANLAVFAYKPSFWESKMNAKWAFESGCPAAERFVTGKNFTGKIVLASVNDDGKTAIVSLVAKKINRGTFEGNEFDRLEDAGIPILLDTKEPTAKIVK